MENSLHKLGKSRKEEIQVVQGIGDSKAHALYAAIELGKRYQSEKFEKSPDLGSSLSIYNYLYPKMGTLDHEEFHVLLMNQHFCLIKDVTLSIGGLTETAADTVDSLCVCFSLNFIFQTFSACLLHPSGIQKCEFPCFRDLFEIAVQERISQVFCCWCGHCGYFEETWVYVLDYFSNSTSLAGSTPSLEKYNDRYLVFFDLHLEIIELISGSLH